MAKTAEIDLVGEILPVGLLKCKNALEAMAPKDVLCVCTDDPSVVENVIRFVHSRKFHILSRRHEKRICRLNIFKE